MLGRNQYFPSDSVFPCIDIPVGQTSVLIFMNLGGKSNPNELFSDVLEDETTYATEGQSQIVVERKI